MSAMAPNDSEMEALKKEKLRANDASLGGFELKAFEALEREFQEAENSIGKQADMVRINEVAIRNLEAEIKNYRDAAEKQEKIIQQMERERQKFGVEASQAGVKYMQALDEVKAREISIIDLQKKILDGENSLKQQSVRSERNMYSKNLVDAQDEIEELKRRMKIMNNQIEQLKEEINTKELALIKEHFDFTKVKALSEELENPLNVHRGQQLEDTDPTTYEMILKTQTLQKCLILKTEQVVEKDLLIQEKERLYVELRRILARQPGPEVAEQLSIYRNNCIEKTHQLKAMQSELQMYQMLIDQVKTSSTSNDPNGNFHKGSRKDGESYKRLEAMLDSQWIHKILMVFEYFQLHKDIA